MSFFKKIKGALGKSPADHVADKVQAEVEETVERSLEAGLLYLDRALPEVGDLLAGEEVTLDVQVKLRLRQKGESREG